jgi:hypothetical protein
MADWMLHDEVKYWSVCQKDNNSMWQLVWFLVSAFLSSLLLGLDLMHVCVVLLLQWASYVANGAALWAHWWTASNQGPFTWEDIFEGWPVLSNDANSSAAYEVGGGSSSSRIVLDCLFTSLFAAALLLGSARRLNRMDRLSYVNQVRAQREVKFER